MSSVPLDLSISEIIRVHDFLDAETPAWKAPIPDWKTTSQDVTSQDLTPAGPGDDGEVPLGDDSEVPSGDDFEFSPGDDLEIPLGGELEVPTSINPVGPIGTPDIQDGTHTLLPYPRPTQTSAVGDKESSPSGGVIKPADGSPSVDSNGPSGDHVGSGLSVGAKAGIGAGVGVVGLILIGLAVFFFLRRRHSSRRRGGPTSAADEASLTPAAELLRDKEMMHASARAADTMPPPPPPPGASSEDGDARRGDSPLLADEPTPTPTAGPREVPSAVAHLVEDGMTEAEIRRLEEEERVLDRAIEQAVRR